MKQLSQTLKFIVLFPVRLYQALVSPFFPGSCRHEPTCSAYMVDAVKEWGAFKGMWLGLKRLSKCHPWGTFGSDPVPKKCDENYSQPCPNCRSEKS